MGYLLSKFDSAIRLIEGPKRHDTRPRINPKTHTQIRAMSTSTSNSKSHRRISCIAVGCTAIAWLTVVMMTSQTTIAVAASFPTFKPQANTSLVVKVVDKKTTRKRRGLQRIEILVNDEPITGYEIDQRANFLAVNDRGMGKRIQSRAKARWKQITKDPSLNKKFEALMRKKKVRTREEAKKLQISFIKGLQRQMVNRIKRDEQAKARQGSRGRAIEELIEEKLKLQEAKRLNLLADDAKVDEALQSIASKNKMDLNQFAKHMQKMGTSIDTMRSRFRTLISWQNVVRRRFGFQIHMLTRDVDRFMDRNVASGDVDLKVHRITIPLSNSANQVAMAQTLQLADAARQSYRGCGSTAELARSLPGAKFEDLGQLKSSAVAEPTRSMLLGASDGDMLPPTLAGGDGIQLWAVCGRNTVALETKKRFQEQGELRQREFAILAQKHLKDLRQDATIVRR